MRKVKAKNEVVAVTEVTVVASSAAALKQKYSIPHARVKTLG